MKGHPRSGQFLSPENGTCSFAFNHARPGDQEHGAPAPASIRELRPGRDAHATPGPPARRFGGVGVPAAMPPIKDLNSGCGSSGLDLNRDGTGSQEPG